MLELLFHLREFVDSCVPGPPEPKRALIRKIELAISQFEKDNERPTVNALRSFKGMKGMGSVLDLTPL